MRSACRLDVQWLRYLPVNSPRCFSLLLGRTEAAWEAFSSLSLELAGYASYTFA